MNEIRDLTNTPSAQNKIEKAPNIELRLAHKSTKWMLGWPEEWSETQLLDYLKNAFFWDKIQWILGSKDESQAYVSFFTYETLTDMRKIGLPLKRSKATRRSDLLRVHLKLGDSYKLFYWVRREIEQGFYKRAKSEEFLGKRKSSKNFEDEDCECPCGCGQIIKPLTNKKLKTTSFDLGTQNIANALGEIKEEPKEPKILSESENNAIDIEKTEDFTERKTEEVRTEETELTLLPETLSD